MIRQIFCAISFLTIVPVPCGELNSKELLGSCRFFPLAGWLLGGLVAGGAWLALGLSLSAPLVAVLVVAGLAWLSRGLHLDGVADLADGLGGGFDPMRRLAIMKDSAIGAFGVVALVLLLLLKTMAVAQLLNSVPVQQALLALALVPALSRWAMLFVAWGSRYPRHEGTGHFMVGQLGFGVVLVASLFILPVILLGSAAFWLPAMLLVLVLFLRRKANQALGGVTGDVLGAAIEWGEALGFVVVCLAL